MKMECDSSVLVNYLITCVYDAYGLYYGALTLDFESSDKRSFPNVTNFNVTKRFNISGIYLVNLTLVAQNIVYKIVINGKYFHIFLNY